jgi:uncharacterized protein YndB with AHSA1/START domain
MRPITITIDIGRAPADVFEYAIDPAHFPEWQRDVVGARMVDEAPPDVVGSRFRTSRRIAGPEKWLTQEVTESDVPRRWTARGIEGPLRPIATLKLEPSKSGESTHVTFEIAYEANGIGKVILPLVIRQTENGAPKSFARLKSILEARSNGAPDQTQEIPPTEG